ncbi:MAG: hypothetical protein FH758_14485 [Firmicutes bacterium]|nr:hypothetical protein [Bacillota bacterium]
MLSYKSICKKVLILTATVTIIVLLINWHIKNIGYENIINSNTNYKAQAAIVLGAYVSPEGVLCDMLEDRVRTAVNLYKEDKVDKILMTGDHGRTSYDEVNHMRKYAENMGVPANDIFMDHAGFSTYESMYRAKDVFCVESAIIVTQNFHLPRAIYIARTLGIKSKGVSADRQIYRGADYYEFREILARNKDFINVNILKPKPTFLGPTLSISGNGIITHD